MASGDGIGARLVRRLVGTRWAVLFEWDGKPRAHDRSPCPARRTSPVTNLYDADDELQDGPLTEPEPLRDLIVAQGMEETGIFVLLFTTDTAGNNGSPHDDDDDDHAADADAAETVSDMATELGVDTACLTLFSDDAYLLQAALGETFVPEPGQVVPWGNA
jgi:hypothetical protein